MKKLLITLTILLMPTMCWGEIPVNHFSDKTNNLDGSITQSIYGYPKYYDNQGQLEIIDTNIVTSQDIGWDWEVKKGVYKLRIKNAGTFEVNHLGDIFSLKLLGLGFYNTDTKERILPAQAQITLSNPIVSGNTISWSLPGGSSYRIEYINDILKDILVIGNTAKTFLKNNKPAGWTANNTWIGLIYDIDTSQSTMIESVDIETEDNLNFKSGGRVKHRIRRAWAKHSTYQEPRINENGDVLNPDESSRIWKRRRIVKAGKYIEAVPVNAVDSIDGELIFNTDVSFQEGVSGYAGTTDNFLDRDNVTTNRDTAGLRMPFTFSTHQFHNLIKFDLSSITPPVTVSASQLDIRVISGLSNDGCASHVRRNLRVWTETGSTWNTYDGTNAWGTAGSLNTTTDITGSDDGSKTETGKSTPFTHSVTNASALWEGFINGTWTNNGFMWYSDPEGDALGTAGDSENATSTNRPKLSITYTATGGARRIFLIN